METQPDGASSNEAPAQDGARELAGGDAPVCFGEDVQASFAKDDLDEPDEPGQADVRQAAAPLRAVPAASVPDPLGSAARLQQPEPLDAAVPSAVPIVPVTPESAKAARQAHQVEELRQLEWSLPEEDPWMADEDEQGGPGRAVIVLGIIAALLLVAFLFVAVSVTAALAA